MVSFAQVKVLGSISRPYKQDSQDHIMEHCPLNKLLNSHFSLSTVQMTTN